MKLRDGCLERSRTDLHLTSTGKGHGVYKPLEPFPPADFGKNDFFFKFEYLWCMVTGYQNSILERSFHRAPPSGLVSDFRIGEHYRTTTGSYHGQKVQKPSHTNILYKKAPGHWNVNYMEVKILHLNFTLTPF